MQPPEHGQIIAQLGFSEAGKGFDAYGNAIPIKAWRKFELSAYGEYGLTDHITLIGDPSWFAFRTSQAHVARPGATEAGARVKILGADDAVLSAQASVRYAVGGKSAQPYADMSRRAQLDLRVLFGKIWDWSGLTGYADTQIAFRTNGPTGHQLRFDATLAARPFARATLMLQSFTAITPGRLGGRFYLSQKIQASGVYDVTDAVAVQLGLVFGLRGVNTSAERGIVSAVWWRF